MSGGCPPGLGPQAVGGGRWGAHPRTWRGPQLAGRGPRRARGWRAAGTGPSRRRLTGVGAGGVWRRGACGTGLWFARSGPGRRAETRGDGPPSLLLWHCCASDCAKTPRPPSQAHTHLTPASKQPLRRPAAPLRSEARRSLIASPPTQPQPQDGGDDGWHAVWHGEAAQLGTPGGGGWRRRVACRPLAALTAACFHSPPAPRSNRKSSCSRRARTRARARRSSSPTSTPATPWPTWCAAAAAGSATLPPLLLG